MVTRHIIVWLKKQKKLKKHLYFAPLYPIRSWFRYMYLSLPTADFRQKQLTVHCTRLQFSLFLVSESTKVRMISIFHFLNPVLTEGHQKIGNTGQSRKFSCPFYSVRYIAHFAHLDIKYIGNRWYHCQSVEAVFVTKSKVTYLQRKHALVLSLHTHDLQFCWTKRDKEKTRAKKNLTITSYGKSSMTKAREDLTRRLLLWLLGPDCMWKLSEVSVLSHNVT